MKRISRLLCLLAFVPLLAQGEADGPDYWDVRGVASDDVLNLREKPDPHSKKIAEIPHNATCLRNLGCQGGLTFEEFTTLSPADRKALEKKRPRWCRIEFQGKRGWVAGRYLQEAAGPCTEPVRSDEESGIEPMHIEGYVVDSAAERPGADYRKDFAANAQECAARCSRDPRCKAFDYHVDSQGCRLKESVPPLRRNPAVISGVKEPK